MIQNVGFQYGDTGRIVLLERAMIPADESNKEYHYGIPGSLIELMQYTCLKDKNGKPIFEGDIVRWGSWKDGTKGIDGTLYKANNVTEVFWDVKGFWSCKKDSTFVMGIYNNVEVIGNIYENENLLK